jgi:capsular exopolysaccharide synthesis family protein
MRRMTSRETAGVARRSAGLVVFAVVVAAGVALVLSLLSTPRYRATADVLAGAGADGVEFVVASGSELVAQTRAVVGDGPELSVEAVGDVLQFTATSTNADNAATAANAYADVYVGASPDAAIVDRAVAPSGPYEPDVARTVLLAALAGLVIGAVAVFVVARRDTSIRSERQLTKFTGVANLAVIPRHPLGEVRPDDVAVLREPNSVESEAYRTLRTVLDFVAQDRPFTVLLVTSPRPGEGKSSVAANLAAAVAQLGRKVVLVDGDLRRPQVHRLFVTGNDRGLSTLLTGEAPLQRCVQRVDTHRNVALLTAGPPPPDPAELLSHERLRLALESLAGASDLVVIDAPPVLPVADPIILAQLADATLLVATAGISDRREWTETLERLGKVDAPVIGTVLLQPDSRVHATPSYRYAPSAAPANWWVTEASRSDSAAPPEHTDPAPVDSTPVDEEVAEEMVDVEAADEVASQAPETRTAESYPWAKRVEAADSDKGHDVVNEDDDIVDIDVDVEDDGEADVGIDESTGRVTGGDAPAG